MFNCLLGHKKKNIYVCVLIFMVETNMIGWLKDCIYVYVYLGYNDDILSKNGNTIINTKIYGLYGN